MNSYDAWLSRNPREDQPVHYVDWGLPFVEDNFDILKCRDCDRPIGSWLKSEENSYGMELERAVMTEFWELPNEDLVCEECFEILVEEVE